MNTKLFLTAIFVSLAITAVIAIAAPTISLAQNMTAGNMTAEGNMTGSMTDTNQTGSISAKKGPE